MFAGVLDEHGSGAQELKKHGSHRLEVLQLDVTDHSQVDRALRHVTAAQLGEGGEVNLPTAQIILIIQWSRFDS